MSNKRKVNIVTLGCAKNIVDSERIAKQLEINGFEVVNDSDDIDNQIAIINTCGFIEDAKKESIDTILQFVDIKNKGKLEKIIVTGCFSERYKEELIKEIPEVDLYFGVESYKEIIESFDADYRKELLGERTLSTPGHYAYLKISEGCDRTCSFCAIPKIRGKHKSLPIEELVNEATNLVKLGVKELILIAQDLTYYGIDIYKKTALADLLEELVLIEGLEWIRLHYAFPANFPMDVLKVMKKHEKICKYIDIPFQHISNNMLKSMRRNITKQQTYDLIGLIRKEVPGIAIRTTLLIGHPGETKKDFEELKEFIQTSKFERLGVFTYSHEEDTHSYQLNDNVSENEKQQRVEELMELQQEVSKLLNDNKIGSILKVIIDRREGDYYIGRSKYDSPEIDGEVLIKYDSSAIKVGYFYKVLITGANEFDLFGQLEDNH